MKSKIIEEIVEEYRDKHNKHMGELPKGPMHINKNTKEDKNKIEERNIPEAENYDIVKKPKNVPTEVNVDEILLLEEEDLDAETVNKMLK